MPDKIENSDLYKAVNYEKQDFGMTKQQISAAVNRDNGNLWSKIKLGTVGFGIVCKVCNVLGLELIVRNPRKNCSYLLNRPKTKK